MLSRDPVMVEETRNDPLCKQIATPRWFFEARKAQANTYPLAKRFKLPMLMLIAGDDTIADARASIGFFENAASANKTIKHYPEHRHELLRELGREDSFQHILDWIQARV